MKILLVNSVCGRQSTGRIVADIKKELIKQGHECVVAYGESYSIADKDDYHIGTEIDRYIHAGMSRVFDNTGFYSIGATKKFIEWIKVYNPDVIHLHNIHGYYLNIDLFFNYLRVSNKRVIWTLHDCWSFTGHCGYFDYVNCNKWRTECHHCPQKNEYPARWILDNSKNNYLRKRKLFTSIENMTIVTPSKWLQDLVKNSFLSKYDVKVINNGIDLEVFQPQKNNIKSQYGISDKILILGVAAIWNRRKGLDTFIELSKVLDNNKYQILLVGLTKKQIEKLPSNIIGICATDSATQLAELYSSADVFINPTLEDNYPTTNIEAISCGTPVITFDTGGSPESALKFGTVVEKNDMDELVKAIKNINTFTSTPVNFSDKETVKKYIKLYCENI